jgi:hypothetical protein
MLILEASIHKGIKIKQLKKKNTPKIHKYN